MLKGHEHSGPLIAMMFNALERSGAISPWAKAEVRKKLIEELAVNAIKFFSEEDSFEEAWLFPRSDSSPYFSNEIVFQAVFDEQERKACDSARRGDFRGLEALIESRGYLRTSDARKLTLAKMRNEKIKKSASISDITILEEIAQIMVINKCTEYAAKKIWLENHANSNAIPSENTLSSKLRRAKRDPQGQLLLALAKRDFDSLKEIKFDDD